MRMRVSSIIHYCFYSFLLVAYCTRTTTFSFLSRSVLAYQHSHPDVSLQAELAEARSEAASLVEVLSLRQASLAATLDGNFPDLRSTVWLSEAAASAAAQALAPQMAENRKRVEDLLREGLVLSEALERGVSASVLERLLPKRWRQYQKGVSGRV
jgi:hypothetical protein